MRIFSNCLEMIREVERDLFEMGIRVQSATVQDRTLHDDEGLTLELNGYDYKLTSSDQMNEMLDYMKIDRSWVDKEFSERVAPELINPGNAWLSKRDLWGKYIHDGTFEYTYNERIRDQLPYVINELNVRPNTRQAIMTVYDQHKDMRNWGGKARVPCSLSYQFLIRNNKLHLLYSMRSCDLLKHFASDAALALLMLEYVSNVIFVDSGYLTHFIGSLHAFNVDLKERGIF